MSSPDNRVGQYARRVGEILGLDEETLAMLERMHPGLSLLADLRAALRALRGGLERRVSER